MAEFAEHGSSISNSISGLATHIGEVLKERDVFFVIPESGMSCRVLAMEPKDQGIALELDNYGPLYLGVEQITMDSFSCSDGRIVPAWMTA